MRKIIQRSICAVLVAFFCIASFAGCNSDELSNAIAATAEEINSLKQEIDLLREKNESLKESVDSFSSRAEAADKEIDDLKNELDERKNEIDSLESKLEESKNEIDSLEGKLEESIAANEEALKQHEEQMLFGQSYITVGGTAITVENYTDLFGDGGSVSYDPVAKVLVLNNIDMSVEGGFISATDSLRIELVGENRITVDGSSAERTYGISCLEGEQHYDLRIFGEGSLEIKVQTGEETEEVFGIRAKDIVMESGELSLSIDAASQKSYGVYAEGNVTVYAASLSVGCGELGENGYDIICLGSLQLYDPIVFEATRISALCGIWDNRGYPNDPTEKIKIYIDQGHNPSLFHNPGAEGNGLYEQDITYKIGMLLFELLDKDSRFEVAVSRPTDTTVLGVDNTSSLAARVEGAESFGADYFISLHTNAYTTGDVRGAEVWVSGSDSEALGFASSVLYGMVESTGQKNRGIKTDGELYLLKNSTMPTVLVEMGFISNPEEAALMDIQPLLFATGLYNGILSYFGLDV